MSVSPAEAELLTRFEQLTGRGLTDLVRSQVLARLPATVWALEEMEGAGLSIVPDPLDIHAAGIPTHTEIDRTDSFGADAG